MCGAQVDKAHGPVPHDERGATDWAVATSQLTRHFLIKHVSPYHFSVIPSATPLLPVLSVLRHVRRDQSRTTFVRVSEDVICHFYHV